MLLHYGIVSCASIIDRFLSAVLEYGDEVSAIASRNLQKAQEKANQYQIRKAYGSYEEMYRDPEIDIVYIASNNATHVIEIKKALSYGKHVICEKPIALCERDCIEVFQIAKAKGCFLMEAQKSVFLPTTLQVKEIIQTNVLGKLHQVEMSCSFPSPTSAWMHDPTQGGVVYGSASYTIEYLDFLIEPKQTQVKASGILEKSGTCERVNIHLLLDDVLVNSCISMHDTTSQHAIFYFEDGSIEVPYYWKARNFILNSKKENKQVENPITYEMIYEVAHIHECIEQKLLESPVMHAHRSITCTSIVDEIQRQLL